MGILSGYLGMEFFEHCYTPLGEMMDMLTLLVRSKEAGPKLIYCSELHDQLHSLLHNVKTVQRNIQVVLSFNLKDYLQNISRKIFNIRRGGIWCPLMNSCSQEDKSIPLQDIYIENYLMVRI